MRFQATTVPLLESKMCLVPIGPLAAAAPAKRSLS